MAKLLFIEFVVVFLVEDESSNMLVVRKGKVFLLKTQKRRNENNRSKADINFIFQTITILW